MTAQTEICANCYRPADECDCEIQTLFIPAFKEKPIETCADCPGANTDCDPDCFRGRNNDPGR